MKTLVEIGFALILSNVFLGACHKDSGRDDDQGSLDPDVPSPDGSGLTDGPVTTGPVFDPEAEALDCEHQSADGEYEKTLLALSVYLRLPATCRDILPEFRAQQKFVLSAQGLTNLRIFQYAYNARSIDITQNSVKDLSVLKDHPYLQTLNADQNLIEDLAQLGSPPNLQQLSINDNALTSFASMAVQPKLESLLAEGNLIRDASPLLARAPNLQTLDLGGNPLGTNIVVEEANCPMDLARVGNALGISEECLHLKGLQTPF